MSRACKSGPVFCILCMFEGLRATYEANSIQFTSKFMCAIFELIRFLLILLEVNEKKMLECHSLCFEPLNFGSLPTKPSTNILFK